MCIQLTVENIIAFDYHHIETCQLDGATSAGYYVLLVTNFVISAFYKLAITYLLIVVWVIVWAYCNNVIFLYFCAK